MPGHLREPFIKKLVFAALESFLLFYFIFYFLLLRRSGYIKIKHKLIQKNHRSIHNAVFFFLWAWRTLIRFYNFIKNMPSGFTKKEINL